VREACRTAATWPGHLTVAVNLSPAQFAAGSVSEVVASALNETGLAPHRLELEITETLLLRDSEPWPTFNRRTSPKRSRSGATTKGYQVNSTEPPGHSRGATTASSSIAPLQRTEATAPRNHGAGEISGCKTGRKNDEDDEQRFHRTPLLRKIQLSIFLGTGINLFWELGQIAVYALSSHNLCHGPDEMKGGSPAQTSWPADITAAGASECPPASG
jgi:hypothetical protein